MDVPEPGSVLLSTKALSGEEPGQGFDITKEMVTEFLKREHSDLAVVSVKGFPSEESPAMFEVNYEKGWKVFPADSRFGLILAESPEEQLDLWEKSDNPGFELWMGGLQ